MGSKCDFERRIEKVMSEDGWQPPYDGEPVHIVMNRVCDYIDELREKIKELEELV